MSRHGVRINLRRANHADLVATFKSWENTITENILFIIVPKCFSQMKFAYIMLLPQHFGIQPFLQVNI